MQLCLLHLDDALKSQPAFWKGVGRNSPVEVDAQTAGAHVRLWGRQEALEQLQTTLRDALTSTANDSPRLCFMGSGDFHHITALLLPIALEACDVPVTVIHFDNHPDWVKFEGGMHCGSWVNRALKHAKVAKIITIGVCSADLRNPQWKGANLQALKEGRLEVFPYAHAPSRAKGEFGSGASYEHKQGYIHWNSIADQGEEAFIALLLKRIETQCVYITVDKDVLSRADAETNWDQGVMRLPFLLRCIHRIGKVHRIISADVNGDYSDSHYAGNTWMRLKKHAEIWLDQPRIKRNKDHAAALNSETNAALLGMFTEVMA